ncbi:single-stranded DNA-binding protein [Mucilaginibacter sp. UYCu711]|uniref:single-stranded DNA-binding protein n=1 Tax=Mucilaginibacter sp. UYCu711 TaxID=3156339 RepID=UPI003D21BDB4
MKSSLVNKVTLIGNIGKEPILKATEKGHVLNFSMATNEFYSTGDAKKQVTDWHNCVAWKGLAETMSKLLNSGTKVLIEGKLKNDNYEKEGGEKIYNTQIEVTGFYLIDPKSKED